jgi:hypothetical protein
VSPSSAQPAAIIASSSIARLALYRSLRFVSDGVNQANRLASSGEMVISVRKASAR